MTISVIRDADGRIIGASKVARDITARKRATDLLRASEARFRFLAETIPSIVWTTAPDGNDHVREPSLARILRNPMIARRPRLPGLTLHPEDEERCTKAWQWHLRKGRDFEIEVRHRRHDGVYRWFVARAVPFRDETEQILSWFGTTTDIHEQKEMEETLRQADRRKDEFLATLAHELRNPLAPIRNALHIMRLKGDDPVTVDQARKIMDRQLGQMVRLVDDLLDVGRITRGKLELRKERIELGAVIKNAIDATRRSFRLQATSSTSVSLPGRSTWTPTPCDWRRCSSNLLNNAAKYMDRGGKIWLSAVAGDNEADHHGA